MFRPYTGALWYLCCFARFPLLINSFKKKKNVIKKNFFFVFLFLWNFFFVTFFSNAYFFFLNFSDKRNIFKQQKLKVMWNEVWMAIWELRQFFELLFNFCIIYEMLFNSWQLLFAMSCKIFFKRNLFYIFFFLSKIESTKFSFNRTLRLYRIVNYCLKYCKINHFFNCKFFFRRFNFE